MDKAFRDCVGRYDNRGRILVLSRADYAAYAVWMEVLQKAQVKQANAGIFALSQKKHIKDFHCLKISSRGRDNGCFFNRVVPHKNLPFFESGYGLYRAVVWKHDGCVLFSYVGTALSSL